MFAPHSQSEAGARFERVKREELPARGGEELVGRDRRGQTIALTMTLARVAAASPPRYCAALRDLGQSKASERTLEAARAAAVQANARKTEFLARISLRSAPRRCKRFSVSPR